MNQKIDIVLPWVDGSDPEWQRVKEESLKKYCPEEMSVSNIRFESWDNLQYWFRAVEKNMPWIHKIFFITWGHLPDFLDTGHPKLEIVRHEDYIPEKYLPTFNSGTIEMNVHRIKELSDNYMIRASKGINPFAVQICTLITEYIVVKTGLFAVFLV